MVPFRRLLLPWSNIVCKVSRASFLVFQASLFESVKIVVPFINPSISTRGNKSSRGSLSAATTFVCPEEVELSISVDVRHGSGAGVPSAFSNSVVIVASNWALRSSKKLFMPFKTCQMHILESEEQNPLDPANSLTVTRVFVALVRTAAFEFCSAVFKSSIKLRKANPAIPNSVSAVLIQVRASARTLGAFCLDNGSYAMGTW